MIPSWLMLPIIAPSSSPMVRPPTSPKYHHPTPQNTPPPTQYIPIPNDNVDLRLAESYTPLCICMAKSTMVILIHTVFSNLPHVSHAISASLLILDRISQPIQERIVDSNSMAWAVLCSFMTYPEKSSRNLSVLYAIWTVLASAHIMNGGVPMIHSNPSTPFWVGLRHHATPIPAQEIMACFVNAALIVTIILLDPMEPTTQRWQGMGIRSSAYFILSSLWSYTVVVISRQNSASGTGIAKVSSVLTASRFMVTFYAPMVILVPWSVSLSVWMSWVCFRHTSSSIAKRKRDEGCTQDVVDVISHLYTLEEAADGIQKGEIQSETPHTELPLPLPIPPPPTSIPSSTPPSLDAQHPSETPADHAMMAAFQAAKAQKHHHHGGGELRLVF